jgi:hypothetical protein
MQDMKFKPSQTTQGNAKFEQGFQEWKDKNSVNLI